VPALLVTRTVDTAKAARTTLIARWRPSSPNPTQASALDVVGDTTARHCACVAMARRCRAGTRAQAVFLERLQDPAIRTAPLSSTSPWMEQPCGFRSKLRYPDIIVKQGDVEDWIIEIDPTNYTPFIFIKFIFCSWAGPARP